MLYYNSLDIRSSHYAVSKALSGVKKLPDCSFSFVDSDRIITVVYHRIAIKCSNSATGVETEKREVLMWVLLWYDFSDEIG